MYENDGHQGHYWRLLNEDEVFIKTVLRHTMHAKATQQFPREQVFVTADKWASYSPDLNPVDYYIWDRPILQDLVYGGRRLPFANLQDRKKGIKDHWDCSKIHCTMEKRLIAVRKQNGGTIQHMLR